MAHQRVLVHEVIGGLHPAGGWQMYAFESTSGPEVMRLSQEGHDVLLLQGDGARSWFDMRAGEGRMTSRWERLVDTKVAELDGHAVRAVMTRNRCCWRVALFR